VDDLPQPFVPADHDVSMLSDFRLNVDRLLASELVAIATPEECWAALMLWCRAWKQIPGGSLPNDERALAGFSGAGRRWKKVRDMALHGFVLCSDGRLYHRFLCDEVTRAYASHLTTVQRRDTDKKRLAEWRAKRLGNGAETPNETRFVSREPEPPPSPDPSPPPEPQESLHKGKDPLGGVNLSVSPALAREMPTPKLLIPGDQNGQKSRIQADWQPSFEDREHAFQLRWKPQRIDREAEEFRDWCLRDDKQFADWSAAWRRWCKTADDQHCPARSNGSTPRAATRSSGSPVDAARNLISRFNLDAGRC
jgi:hypothetical protein